MQFETVKRNFDKGFWPATAVKRAAEKGFITAAQYEAITSEAPGSDTVEAIEQRSARFAANEIISTRMQRRAAQAEAFTATEFATFAKAGLFDSWTVGNAYAKGDRFIYSGIVYEAQQPVTAQAHQAPGSEGMLAVYRPLSVDAETGVEADGTQENPYAFISGMDVYSSKYYAFESKLYLAKADMIPCVWNPGTAGLWQWELVA